ncbi:hypothetical protein [Roseovarius mucosus]|uniref:hypothetical protein n=1 Tax=Roseovarius mucosus TaxID=215743 RepID=UPI003F71767B
MNSRTLPSAGLKTPLHKTEWNTQRLKFLFQRVSRPVCDEHEVVTAFRDGVVTRRSNRREDGFTFADKEIGYQGIQRGDLAIHAMDGFAGAIGVSASEGKVSPVLSVLVPRDERRADPQFWAYYLRNLAVSGYISSLAKGIRERSTDFRWKDAGDLLVNHPDLPTQKRIAAFLDRETARIDELIAKKERLGDVIDQRRLAVITAAVAGKIGPAAETTAALGVTKREIRLRFMLQVAPSAREIENLTAEDEVTFAPMDALDDGLGGLDATMSRPLGEVAAGSYNYFREDDVLLAKVTPCFENGKKALARGLINGVGFATSEVHVFRPTPGKLDARFLMYLFSSEDFRAEGMKSMTGAGGLKRVSDTAILNYRPHVIDVDLQRKVADFLDREMGVFEVIKDRTKASIDRLREYRAALITAAVTGQIDVDSYGKAGTPSATLDRIEEEMQG